MQKIARGSHMNWWISAAVKRNCSIFARLFPRHSRFPEPNAMNPLVGARNFPVFLSKNLVGSNLSGSGKSFGSWRTENCKDKIFIDNIIRLGWLDQWKIRRLTRFRVSALFFGMKYPRYSASSMATWGTAKGAITAWRWTSVRNASNRGSWKEVTIRVAFF